MSDKLRPSPLRWRRLAPVALLAGIGATVFVSLSLTGSLIGG